MKLKMKKKFAVLKANETFYLKKFLSEIYLSGTQYSFEKNTLPSYKPSKAIEGYNYTTIDKVIDKIYVFEKGFNLIKEGRRESILIQMLESISSREADILCQILTNSYSNNNLNKEIVMKAFPNLK